MFLLSGRKNPDWTRTAVSIEMKLHKINPQKKYNRVVGVDTSTRGFAYAVIDSGTLVEYDEVIFQNDDLHMRMDEAWKAARKIADFDADFAVVEQVVFVRNKIVAIKLAYFVGFVLAALTDKGTRFTEVVPYNWQQWIGNPKFTTKERAAVKQKNKSKSASWIRNEIRKQRKQRTIDWCYKRWRVHVTNDNIGDAIAIATYAWEEVCGN